jgi:hypothetical protein
MTTAEADRSAVFSGTAVRFEYDPKKNCVTTRRMSALLDGLGYDRVTCVNDEQEGVVIVAAVKPQMVRLTDHDYEVGAIRNVVRENIEVNYYRVRVTDHHIYDPDDFMADK